MKYQKTFAFDANHCPKLREDFWRRIENISRVNWSEAFITEEEVQFIASKIRIIKVVIQAKTISHLCTSCFELGLNVEREKTKGPGPFIFSEATAPEMYTEDEKINTGKRK
jgi:hypothetical protein